MEKLLKTESLELLIHLNSGHEWFLTISDYHNFLGSFGTILYNIQMQSCMTFRNNEA